MRARLSRIPLLVPLLALLLLAPGATSPFTGCSGDDRAGGRACTEIGCSDGVTFVVARRAIEPVRGVVAKACLDGRCRTHRIDPDQFSEPGGVPIDAWFPPDTLDARATHRASITIQEGRRTIFELERRIELETSQPNGAGCPPTCHNATVRITAADVRTLGSR